MGHSARDDKTVLYDSPVSWVWAVKVGNDQSMLHCYGRCSHEQVEHIKCPRNHTGSR
jgi:hypothetical protein